MPPAMTSSRGAVRASSTSGGMNNNGMIPRREPLRRLYPLQRASRTQSDSIRELSGISDENATPKTVLLIDADAVLRRRQIRPLNRTSTSQGTSSQSMTSKPEKIMYRYDSPDRYVERGVDRTLYSRPSLIRRSSDVGSVSSYNSSMSCPIHGGSGRGGSILKRPSSSRNKNRDVLLHSHHKQVQFCPNVSVVHMDEDGEHLLTHFQQLNGEKRKRLGTLTRHAARDYDNVIYLNENSEPVMTGEKTGNQEHGGRSDSSKSSARDNRPLRDAMKRLGNSGNINHNHTQENTPLKKGQFNITFTTRTGEPTKMKFVLHMGQDYNPNDLVVKANTTGSRIRVLATRLDRTSRVSEEYDERFQLPMDIDPYEIEARLDKWGNLTVDAPLMTSEKRPDVNKNTNGSILSAVYV